MPFQTAPGEFKGRGASVELKLERVRLGLRKNAKVRVIGYEFHVA